MSPFRRPLGGNERHLDKFKVYRRVASTIRALAGAGRAVIVGRGGAFITADLAAGIHVRIVAPAEFRVREMARRLGISADAAADVVREILNNQGRPSLFQMLATAFHCADPRA